MQAARRAATVLRQQKRRRLEEEEAKGVADRLHRVLLGDVVNIVLEYSPTFYLREHGEAHESAKFWAHQLRWWVRHSRHDSPDFAHFDLHELHKPEWMKIRRRLPLHWETLTYWELLAHLRNHEMVDNKRRCK